MKAILRNYRQSPRKVALAAGLVRGKTAGNALIQLKFATKRASSPLVKLIESAMANARNQGVASPEMLTIQEIRVDKGVVLKRIMPRARGSAARILKRSSNIILVLGEAKKSKKALKKAVSVEAEEKPAKVKKVAKTKKVTK